MSTQGRHRAPAPWAWRILVHLVSAALLLGVLALATALIVVPKLTGAVPLTVLTGSMSPTYAPGTVVVTRPTPVEQLQIGDAITFQEKSGDPRVVTHRIVGIGFGADGSRQFTTQGDANGAPDTAPVTAPQVRGKVWYAVPYVGHALAAVDASTRSLLLDIAAAGLVLHGLYLVTAGLRDARRRRGRSSAVAALRSLSQLDSARAGSTEVYHRARTTRTASPRLLPSCGSQAQITGFRGRDLEVL